MPKLITLNCPNCGAPIGIDDGEATIQCNYCASEHLIISDNESYSLKNNIICPRCNKNDAVKKVSSLVWKNPDLISFFKPAEETMINRKTITFFQKKRGIIHPSWILWGLIVPLSLLLISGFIKFTDDVRAGKWLHRPFYDYFIQMAVYIFVGFVWWKLFELYQNKKKIGEKGHSDQVKEKDEDYKKELFKIEVGNGNGEKSSLWISAIKRWDKLYFCERDNCIFIPGEEDSYKPDELPKLVYGEKIIVSIY